MDWGDEISEAFLLLRGWALENKKKHVGISRNYISMHAYAKKINI